MPSSLLTHTNIILLPRYVEPSAVILCYRFLCFHNIVEELHRDDPVLQTYSPGHSLFRLSVPGEGSRQGARDSCIVQCRQMWYLFSVTGDQGPVARRLVSANRWLRGIKTYRFPWHLTLVSSNQTSSNLRPVRVAGSMVSASQR